MSRRGYEMTMVCHRVADEPFLFKIPFDNFRLMGPPPIFGENKIMEIWGVQFCQRVLWVLSNSCFFLLAVLKQYTLTSLGSKQHRLVKRLVKSSIYDDFHVVISIEHMHLESALKLLWCRKILVTIPFIKTIRRLCYNTLAGKIYCCVTSPLPHRL